MVKTLPMTAKLGRNNMKKLKRSLGFTSYCAVIISAISLSSVAESVVSIPKVQDAKVFAEFNDKLPAVSNYYSHEAEQALVEFYMAIYGEPLYQERKRGRLSLAFQTDDNNVRVILSQQNTMRQVDVIVTQR